MVSGRGAGHVEGVALVVPGVGGVLGPGDGVDLDGQAVGAVVLLCVVVQRAQHVGGQAHVAAGRHAVGRPLGLLAVAHVLDVGEGGRAVVRVVAGAVEVLGLQPDAAALVVGQDVAGQVLGRRGARPGAGVARVAREAAPHLFKQG